MSRAPPPPSSINHHAARVFAVCAVGSHPEDTAALLELIAGQSLWFEVPAEAVPGDRGPMGGAGKSSDPCRGDADADASSPRSVGGSGLARDWHGGRVRVRFDAARRRAYVQCTAGLDPGSLAEVIHAEAHTEPWGAASERALREEEVEGRRATLSAMLCSHVVLWVQHTRVFDIAHLRTLRTLQRAKATLAPAIPAILERHDVGARDHGCHDGGGGGWLPGCTVPTLLVVNAAPRASRRRLASGAGNQDGGVRSMLRQVVNGRGSEGGEGTEAGVPRRLFDPCFASTLIVPPPRALLPAFASAFAEAKAPNRGCEDGGTGGASGAGSEDDWGSDWVGELVAEVRAQMNRIERTFGKSGNADATSGKKKTGSSGDDASTRPTARAWAAAAEALVSVLGGVDGVSPNRITQNLCEAGQVRILLEDAGAGAGGGAGHGS